MAIIVIDDSATALAVLKTFSRSAGMQDVVAFTSALDGLAYLRDHVAQAIVVDCSMPVMDGIDFIRHVRQMDCHANTPIIMVTAATDAGLQASALAAGACEFLNKPVRLTQFKAALRSVLGQDAEPVTNAA